MLFFTPKEITRRERFFLSRNTSFLLISMIVCYLQILVLSIETAVAHECNECTANKHEDTGIQREISKELFNLLDETPVDGNIKYDGNYYGCNCHLEVEVGPKKEKVPAYKGGHAGWDVLTTNEFDPTRDRGFHCITPGIVLANGGRDENGKLPDCNSNNRTIVIYDEITGYATHYLHASDIHPDLKVGKYAYFGQPLGRQGACGRVTGPHVHIEVRTLEWYCEPGIPYKDLTKEMINNLVESSYGTKDIGRPTLDPIQYLYDCVKNPNSKRMCPVPEIWARCKIGQ